MQQHIFCKGKAGSVHDFVESCQVCQTEISDHTLIKGKLQSIELPQQEWWKISLKVIADLSFTRNKKNSVLTVGCKNICMIHLIQCRKDIAVSDTARLVWWNVVKLHGIHRAICSDRGTQFISIFGKSSGS